MRILITGGLGLIGSAISRHALEVGHHVVICDDGRSAVVETIDGALHYTNAIEGLYVEGIDAVVHCAGPVGPVGILGRDVLAEMTSATRAACGLAEVNRARLLVFSSSEVYGTVNPSGSLVVPDDWSHRTEYAVGKIVTEQIARRHHATTGLPTCIVRPWNITGPGQSAAAGFVFPRMSAQAAAGQPITVYHPGNQRRAFMAVGDLAKAVVGLLDGCPDCPPWHAEPIDAANPDNAIDMLGLAAMFSPSAEIVDPADEHGASFREAAAGSKLPPPNPTIRGTTPLAEMVNAAMAAVPVPA